MTLRLSILFIGILFLSSCEEMFDSGEIITSDYEPELNVYGFISFDNLKPSFVYVHRTLSLDENPNDYSPYFVNDAEVFIIDSLGNSNPFQLNENSSNETYEEPDGFVPQFDAYYTLEVAAQNGMSITGTLHTPPEPILLVDQIPEIIYPDSLFTLKWNTVSDAIAHIKVVSANHSGCYINRTAYFENGETEWTTKIFSCAVEGINNPDNLSIQLTFMDINYYDYFVAYDDDNFLNFIMGISGSTQDAFGVEGGLGVFGSYATDIVILPFDP